MNRRKERKSSKEIESNRIESRGAEEVATGSMRGRGKGRGEGNRDNRRGMT
jgi:hypothetical protein